MASPKGSVRASALSERVIFVVAYGDMTNTTLPDEVLKRDVLAPRAGGDEPSTTEGREGGEKRLVFQPMPLRVFPDWEYLRMCNFGNISPL